MNTKTYSHMHTCTHPQLQFDSISYSVLCFISLLVPPSCKDHLSVDECAILVQQQLLNDSVKNVQDGCMLAMDAAILASIVEYSNGVYSDTCNFV